MYAAMFNIEMIGTESKWGTNSAYMTGYEKTDMKDPGKNPEGSVFKFYPDPYPQQDCSIVPIMPHWPDRVCLRTLFPLPKWTARNSIILPKMK